MWLCTFFKTEEKGWHIEITNFLLPYAETQFPTSPGPFWVKCCQLDKMRPVKTTVIKKNMGELIVFFRLQKE